MKKILKLSFIQITSNTINPLGGYVDTSIIYKIKSSGEIEIKTKKFEKKIKNNKQTKEISESTITMKIDPDDVKALEKDIIKIVNNQDGCFQFVDLKEETIRLRYQNSDLVIKADRGITYKNISIGNLIEKFLLDHRIFIF